MKEAYRPMASGLRIPLQHKLHPSYSGSFNQNLSLICSNEKIQNPRYVFTIELYFGCGVCSLYQAQALEVITDGHGLANTSLDMDRS